MSAKFEELIEGLRVLAKERDRDVEMYATCNARQADTICKKNKVIAQLEAKYREAVNFSQNVSEREEAKTNEIATLKGKCKRLEAQLAQKVSEREEANTNQIATLKLKCDGLTNTLALVRTHRIAVMKHSKELAELNNNQAVQLAEQAKRQEELDKSIRFLYDQHTPYMLRLKALMDDGTLKRLKEHALVLGAAFSPDLRKLGDDLLCLVEAVGAKS